MAEKHESTVTLNDDEWTQVMNALIQSHPLLMKLANQLREQQTNSQQAPAAGEQSLGPRTN